MASLKLVSPAHLPLYYPVPYPPFLAAGSLPPKIMTFEDNLPRRAASTDYDPGSDSARDMSSPPSPGDSESMTPGEGEGRDSHGQIETPNKKNKRKLSEPKKRSDSNITKRPRASSPTSRKPPSAEDDSSPGNRTGRRKLTNGNSKRSSKAYTARGHTITGKSDTPSSSSSTSNLEGDTVAKDVPFAPLTSVMPPHFIPPVFAGMSPSPFGYVPGMYMPGQSFVRPGLHPHFPSIPLNHLHHSYMVAAAAAASHASATATSQSTAQPLQVSSTPSLYTLSRFATSSSSSSSHLPNSDKTSSQHPKSNRHLPPSPLPPSLPADSSSPFSLSHLQPSYLHRPGSSKTVPVDDDDASSSRAPSPEDLSLGGKLSRKHRKNYKNMTRERRVEANARERTRVHTISAAFDALRRAVPSYSHNQKLSKLAILRIASSYILALARLNDQDYTSATDHIKKPLTFAECVDLCTSTIQTEGRARRRH